MEWNSSYDRMKVSNTMRNKKSAPYEESTYYSRKQKVLDMHPDTVVIKALNC